MDIITATARQTNIAIIIAIVLTAAYTPPPIVRVTRVDTHGLSVSWTPGNSSSPDSFRVVVTENGHVRYNETFTQRVTSTDIPDLLPGHLYNISVWVVKSGQQSAATTVTTYTVPLPPVISSWSIAWKTIIVTWSAGTDSQQDHYTVKYVDLDTSTAEQNACSQVTNKTCKFEVSGDRGTKYELRITAERGDQKSNTTTQTFFTAPPGVTPETVSAVHVTENSVTIRWTKPATTKIDGYVTSSSAGQVTVVNQNLTSYEVRVDSLSAGQMFTVSIRTKREHRLGMTIQKRFYTMPLPPVISSWSIAWKTIIVTWSAGTDSQQDHYTVKYVDLDRSTAEQNACSQVTNKTCKFEVSGDRGTKYELRITAERGDQKSNTATQTLITAPLSVSPETVSAVRVTENSVTITWTKPTATRIDGYVTSASAGQVTVVNQNLTSYEVRVDSLSAGQMFTVSIQTKREHRLGMKIQKQFYTRPKPPTNLVETADTSSSIILSVQWTKPNKTDITHYEALLLSHNQQIANKTVNNENIEFTGLTAGTLYTLQIFTVTNNMKSEVLEGEFSTVPDPPASVIVSRVTNQGFRLYWTRPANGNAKSYVILIRKLDPNAQKPYNTSNLYYEFSSQSDGLFVGGRSYGVQLSSLYRGKKSAVKETQVTLDPNPPVGIRITSRGKSDLQVSWQKPAGRVDQYLVEVYQNNDKIRNFTANSTSTRSGADITNLAAGTTYTVKIYSELLLPGGVRRSDTAAEITNTTLPEGVGELKVKQVTTTSVEVTWTAPNNTNFDHYRLTINPKGTGTISPVIVLRTGVLEASFTNLIPGQTYRVVIVAVNNGAMGDQLSRMVTTIPTCDSVITEIVDETTTDRIVMRYTAHTGVFNSYLFSLHLNGVSLKNKTKLKSDERQVEFGGLAAGNRYVVEMRTVSSGERSAPKRLQVVTVPRALRNVIEETTSTHITLTFLTPLPDRADFYDVACTGPRFDPANQRINQTYVNNQPTTIRVTFSQLTPYTVYTLTVTPNSGGKKGKVWMSNIKTDQDVTDLVKAPEQVRNFGKMNVTFRSVTLIWEPPGVTNGIITAYEIQYSGRKDNKRDDGGLFEISDVNRLIFNLTDLKPAYTYTVKIRAKTVRFGPYISIELTTLVGHPRLIRNESVRVLTDLTTSSTVTTEVSNVFSDEEGDITGYTVIVSKYPVTVSDDRQATWAESIKNEAVIFYQAFAPCDIFLENWCVNNIESRRTQRSTSPQVAKIIIGGNDCDRNLLSAYCNGPLKSEMTYYLKLRAYNEVGRYEDTPYSSAFTTKSGPAVNVIVVSVVMSFLLLVSVVIICILYRKLRRSKNPRHGTGKDDRSKVYYENAVISEEGEWTQTSSNPSNAASRSPENTEMHEYDYIKPINDPPYQSLDKNTISSDSSVYTQITSRA